MYYLASYKGAVVDVITLVLAIFAGKFLASKWTLPQDWSSGNLQHLSEPVSHAYSSTNISQYMGQYTEFYL